MVETFGENNLKKQGGAMARKLVKSHNVNSVWPGASGMNKSGKGVPAGCVHWQERAYDRNPKTLSVSEEVWEECRKKYERRII